MINLNKFPKVVLNESDNNSSIIKSLNFSFKVFNLNSSLFFPKKSSFNFNLTKNKGELVELIFFGLNYNAKRVRYQRKPFLLDLQKSHKIKVDESRISEIKTKIFKRRLLLFSFDKNKLISLINLLKSNRPMNSYSGHGLISRTDKYATKPGKIRQK